MSSYIAHRLEFKQPCPPVRRMQNDLADIVSSGSRAPEGLPGRQTAQGSTKVRPVPRLLVEGLIDETQEYAYLGSAHGWREAGTVNDSLALVTSSRAAQPGRWSLTSPMACMKA